MLSEDEERMLNSIIETNTDDLMFGTVEDLKTKLETIGWLATKLQETNEEFKKFKKEVDKLVDEEWQKHWERNKEEDDAE